MHLLLYIYYIMKADMQQLIRLAEVTMDSSVQIANMLSNDELLAKANGSSLVKVNPQEFFDKTKQWQIATNSESYIISLGSSSIGLISLSHINSTSIRGLGKTVAYLLVELPRQGINDAVRFLKN